MGKGLAAPSEAMPDISELELFFDVWKRALGPAPMDPSLNGTEAWLHGFGTQTKWLTGDAWTWWIDHFSAPSHIDLPRAKNFLSLIIGMLGTRSSQGPQGEAVKYAREIGHYLEAREE